MTATKFSVARFDADAAPVPEGMRCIRVLVPDDVFYVRLLAGVYALATQPTNWEGEQDARETAAQLVNVAFTETDWEECMDCATVADCIENDEGTQDAILEREIYDASHSTDLQDAYKEALQRGMGEDFEIKQSGDTLYPAGEGCNQDHLARMVDTFVDWMDDNNHQFFEAMVAAFTPAQRAEAISKEIPGFSGDLIVGTISEAFTFISGALKTNYEAQYDVTYADALKCEIWCAAKEDCNINVRQLYALLSARIGYMTPLENFYHGLVFTVTGAYTGTQFCDVAMFIQLGAWLKMGGFAGMLGINPFQNAMTSGWDDGSNDFVDDCVCAEEWLHVITADDFPDFLTFPNLGFPVEPVGQITDDVISATASSTDFVSGIYILIDMAAAEELISIKIEQTAGTNAPGGGSVNQFINCRDAGGFMASFTQSGDFSGNGAQTVLLTDFSLFIQTIEVQSVYLGGTITKDWTVTIKGRGTNPFV